MSLNVAWNLDSPTFPRDWLTLDVNAGDHLHVHVHVNVYVRLRLPSQHVFNLRDPD
jgi:hypothetical protein